MVNEKEINAMYAFAGLSMEYAPWAAMDSNVLSLTLADSAEMKDDHIYSVAAWAGSIDERYISGTGREFPELGKCREVMKGAVRSLGTIAPAEDKRITLKWDRN